MEHRCCRRYEMRLTMDLHHRGRRLGRCFTRNISRAGLCVQSDDQVIKPNDIVQLQTQYKGHQWVLRGIVVHSGGPGIGIMLLEGADNWYQAIIDELQRGDTPPVPDTTPEHRPRP